MSNFAEDWPQRGLRCHPRMVRLEPGTRLDFQSLLRRLSLNPRHHLPSYAYTVVVIVIPIVIVVAIVCWTMERKKTKNDENQAYCHTARVSSKSIKKKKNSLSLIYKYTIKRLVYGERTVTRSPVAVALASAPCGTCCSRQVHIFD